MRNLNALLITFALVAALCVPAPAVAGIMLDRVVAVVNDEAITWGELYSAIEFELSRDKRSLSVAQKKAIFEENEALFLENMINTRLQLQEAQKLHIGVSDMDINFAIESVKRKNSLTDEQFIKALQADGFTLEEYRERLAEQITIGKLVDFAVKSKIVISDEDLKDVPEGDAFYRIRQIFFKVGAGPEEKAEAVMEELAAGASFAELARKHSEDALAATGGDLGLIQKSKMIGEFASAVEGLKRGEVSEPFKTGKGIHIIKLEEIRGIREVLTEERLTEAYAGWLRDLRENTFIEIRL
jgi:peptidyl-prolyl cis-trans isomerase SurA